MPLDWIHRTLQPVLDAPAEQLRLFPVWLLLGPRQVGKSSLLHRCSGSHAYANLDDLDVRERANWDPVLFMRDLRPPFVIDEIQYAPKLLSAIKRMVDEGGLAPGAIRLTGSQNFRVMEGVTETLAGRVAILNLLGLSDEEKRLPHLLSPGDYFGQNARDRLPAVVRNRGWDHPRSLSCLLRADLYRAGCSRTAENRQTPGV